MLKLLTNRDLWDTCSSNGINRVREHYTWQSHCQSYLECVRQLIAPTEAALPVDTTSAPGQRLASLDSLLITDIDNTLLGDDEALAELKEIIAEHRDHLGFGVASGRALELVNQALEENGIEDLDVIISSVGSEIYYGNEQKPDKGWSAQLRAKWRPDRIREVLSELAFLSLQREPHTQREFKISYDLDPSIPAEEALPLVHDALAQARVGYSLIFSHGTFVDILPYRASKGKAVRYLAGKWHIPLQRVATAGDSGNDRDMLIGHTAGIVVGNYDRELENLKRSKSQRIYFAKAHCAGGIIEGLRHYALIRDTVASRDGDR
jgi:sucrose-phosphate synthase